MQTRRQTLFTFGAAAATPALARAESHDPEVGQALASLFFGDPEAAASGLAFLEKRGDPDAASTLILALRFARGDRPLTLKTLAAITGETGRNDWFDWMLWQESHPEIASHPEYYLLKRAILLSIEPNWEDFLKPELIGPGAMDIRFEEVAWGGVRRDGIPSLDNPALIDARAADYLKDDDLVFGVEINGDARAYPLRIMGWHEMFNDVIGGVPVALAYCTLCGAGILFETAYPGREEPFVMGTSGFLYRSNKLMYDRQTLSLWNQFTGEPVHGPLRGAGVALAQRPVTIEPWGAWRGRNPETKVLSLETGHFRDYGSGVVYAAYFASDDLMFPAAVDETRLRQKDYVFGVRSFAGAKAWPISAFAGGRAINDRVGAQDVVLIGDAAGRTVRAYDREGLSFDYIDAATLRADGQSWRVTEAALVGDDGRRLGRVAGHIAYWFAWNGYLGPRSELYSE